MDARPSTAEGSAENRTWQKSTIDCQNAGRSDTDQRHRSSYAANLSPRVDVSHSW